MIAGSLVNLRLTREKDLEELYQLKSDLSQRGKYWPLNLQSESDLKKRFSENGFWTEHFGSLLITNMNNKIVGEINYFRGLWYMPGYEVGYQIFCEEDRGKGYVSEALKLFTKYLFDSKQINRLEIEVTVGNAASAKVAQNCGFKYEGLKRQAVYSRGDYLDVELYALLRDDMKV